MLKIRYNCERAICPLNVIKIIIHIKIYIINMAQTEIIIERRDDLPMNEIGEIVVTPVPAGETVICG